VHHTGFRVDAGNNHKVVREVWLARSVPDGFGMDYHDDLALFGQLLLQRSGSGLDIFSPNPVVPEQHRQVSDISVAREFPDRTGTRCARGCCSQGRDLLLGGLTSGDLADHIGDRHLPAIRRVLLAPIGRGGGRVAVHP
jgi:hypothetical protein